MHMSGNQKLLNLSIQQGDLIKLPPVS